MAKRKIQQDPILVTGVAGFIGFHTATRLLERGERVIGLDNINDYYDPNLKLARLARLPGQQRRVRGDPVDDPERHERLDLLEQEIGERQADLERVSPEHAVKRFHEEPVEKALARPR